MGQPSAYERVEGVRGNREVPPCWTVKRGLAGETWFPPRERAGGEGRSCSGELELADRDLLNGPDGKLQEALAERAELLR